MPFSAAYQMFSPGRVKQPLVRSLSNFKLSTAYSVVPAWPLILYCEISLLMGAWQRNRDQLHSLKRPDLSEVSETLKFETNKLKVSLSVLNRDESRKPI